MQKHLQVILKPLGRFAIQKAQCERPFVSCDDYCHGAGQ